MPAGEFSRRTSKVLLTIAAVCITLAVAVAHTNPATSYVGNIYANTPLPFWVLTGVALLVTVFVSGFASERRVRWVGAAVGALTMCVIACLPLLRSYYFIGEGDSMTHLGIAKFVSRGVREPTELFYPVLHVETLQLKYMTGLDLEFSFILMTYLFVGCFVLSVGACVHLLGRVGPLSGEFVPILAGFSGTLLLPVNWFNVQIVPHPATQAILFSPFLVYLLLSATVRQSVRHLLLLVVVSIVVIWLHPMIGVGFTLVFGSVLLVQQGSSRIDWRDVANRNVTSFTLTFGLMVWLSIAARQRFETMFGAVVTSQLATSEAVTSRSVVETRSSSLEELGSSFVELVLRAFVPTIVLCAFAAGTGIYVLWTTVKRRCVTRYRESILYLSLSVVPISLLFVVMFVSGVGGGRIGFRYQGFAMAFVTILGAVGTVVVADRLEESKGRPTARLVVTLFVLLLVLLTVPTLHASPYIYQPSTHVPEGQVDGYETAFDIAAADYDHLDIRSPGHRYSHAIYGTTGRSERLLDSTKGGSKVVFETDRARVPDQFADRQLQSRYSSPKYLHVTAADRFRDVVMYGGFRFSEESFEYLERQPGINRVHANGQHTLYLVE